MQKCWKAFICAVLMAGLVAPSQSQPALGLAETTEQMEATLEGRTGKPVDVRLVIDVSGSMKRNDPANLRQPAVDLLMQLLPDDSKAGVWTFGKWVNMLVPHQMVDEQWRTSGRAKASEINSVGLYTNIGEALEKAAYDMSSPNEDYAKHIMLLTDGMVDIDKNPDTNTEEWRRIVDDVLPKLKQAGYTVHTVALSDNADNNLLKKLSLQTDGIASVARSAEDLMKIFLATFDAAAPAEQVPLSDNQFVIDSSVEEFTALIFRKNPADLTQLIGPDETIYSAASHSEDASWHRADKYDLITIQQPLEGEWGLDVDMDEDSRVTVVSNLNLAVKPMANNVYIGHEQGLSLVLQEDGKTITRPEFLSLMEISATMMAGNDDRSMAEFWQATLSSDSPPPDGRYIADIPILEKEGVYELTVLVDGKSFQRRFNHVFSVRAPFQAEVNKQFSEGKLDYVLTVESLSASVKVDETQMVATITAPSKRKNIRPLELTEMDTWQAILTPADEGMYYIDIKIKGVTLDGASFETHLPEVKFNYSNEGGFSEELDPVVGPESDAQADEKKGEESTKETSEVKGEASAEEASPKEEPSPAEEPVPAWLLYTAIGIGNLLLFVGGFFIIRKILGKGDSDDLLDQFSEESVEEATAPKEEPESAVEDVEEEEPPMEDLDPVDESDSAVEDDPNMDLMEQPEPDEPPVPDETELEDDGIDDLDEMALEEPESEEPAADETSSEEDPEEQDDDDMVSAMLKAQGLDLADEELDDAISNLIDDLEDEDDQK